MSGIIHINGKDYDEEGNLISPVKTEVQFVDGIKPKEKADINNEITTPIMVSTPKKIDAPRAPQIQPTIKLQKSQTLNRFAVRKPNSTLANQPSAFSQIQKNKKPSVRQDVMIEKNPNIVRTAKIANTVSQLDTSKPTTENIFIPVRKTEEMIQAQLEAATAHLMTFKKPNIIDYAKKHVNSLSKHHRRFVLSTSAIAVSLLFIGGLIYINLPSISIQVASSKAGFDAQLPSYTPNGYSIKNPIGYTPGKVVLSFESNTNDMKYTIEQKPTGWTSETLREQVESSSGSQYQTQYANGLTIFFTSEGTATWVDRGVIFTFQGDSGLSIDQIANIAASM